MPFRSYVFLTVCLFLAFTGVCKADLAFSGYIHTRNSSADAAAMAKAAIKLKNIFAEGGRVSLVRLKSTETQKVSGTNFRFCLRVKNGKRRYDVKAVVYRNLSGKPMLTEWKPNGC